MKVLTHYIYEYKKGLRKLVLHTMDSNYRELAEKKLQSQKISYEIREVTDKKINIFFGADECIEVIRSFGNKKLNQFSPEEDYILGTMLGYDKIQQCQRYLHMRQQQVKLNGDNLHLN